MKKQIFVLSAIGIGSFLISKAQIPSGGFGAGGPAGGGTTVTVAAPYVTIGATKYVASTMWPFTTFFTGGFLDTNTSTLTPGTNGSELMSCNCNSTNSWYSVGASTSIEAEFGFTLTTSNANSSGGIWIYDSTNSKIFSWELTTNNGTTQTALQETSWTCASPCNNPSTPSSPSVLVNVQVGASGAGAYHLKLAKSSTNLLCQMSLDAGQTYTQFNSTAVGTLTKAGVDLRGASTDLISATFLSVAVN